MSSGTVKIVASKVLSVNQDICYCVSAHCQSLSSVLSFENVCDFLFNHMFGNFGLRLRHCDRYVVGTANSVVLIVLKSFDFFKC